MNQKNGNRKTVEANGEKNQNGMNEVANRKTVEANGEKNQNGMNEVANDTLVKALKAEWRKNGSKPMTPAQAEEIKAALEVAKEKKVYAQKAIQDAEDAESQAIGLVVKYSGQTTVTLDGKRQIISCRGKSLFLKSMPVFDEGVTI